MLTLAADLTPEQATIKTLLTWATLLPLFSSVAIIFFGRIWKERSAWIATGVMTVSCMCALGALFSWVTNKPDNVIWLIKWIPLQGSSTDAQWLSLGLFADSLTVALMVMVTLISTLVHLYSIGYMCGDKRYSRFFAYLSLFTFAMLGIVTANGLMQLFVFWELVGLTSYLLIGFWFEKRGPQLACKKAFVMNRIGDMGFLIGFGILFHKLGAKVLLASTDAQTGALGMYDALTLPMTQGGLGVDIHGNPPLWLTIAGIGLFFGAIGKSAQFPLHTWLPDAMEGPTPVSSIVHSATMVAAGVYLTARIYPILTPDAHLFVATIGLITLVMAACMALVMTDIKRVLAYSTLSQLGYMILGLGAGAYTFALFHLITHAFFKCALFQCSGSVINAAHHEQDMRQYGGLGAKMPKTMAAYGICTLAIAGASVGPWFGLTGGYYSKDGIIAGCVNYGQAIGGIGNLFWIGPMVVAYITAFYMARSFALTFMGTPRNQHLYEHVKEVSWHMYVPQFVLAFMAFASMPFITGWFSLIQASEPAIDWVQHAKLEDHSSAMSLVHGLLLYGVGWILAIGAGIYVYRDGFLIADRLRKNIPLMDILHTWAINKFYFDEFYDGMMVALAKLMARLFAAIDKYLVDGLVNLVAYVTRFLGWAVGLIDNGIVDGIVNGAATCVQSSGRKLATTHDGQIRSYVRFMFAAGVLIILIIVTVTGASR
jgi:NADH-quinone oxidoreductase subunit L